MGETYAALMLQQFVKRKRARRKALEERTERKRLRDEAREKRRASMRGESVPSPKPPMPSESGENPSPDGKQLETVSELEPNGREDETPRSSVDNNPEKVTQTQVQNISSPPSHRESDLALDSHRDADVGDTNREVDEELVNRRLG